MACAIERNMTMPPDRASERESSGAHSLVDTASEKIAIVDLADDLQVRKQRIFKILPRLGIRPSQRRDPSRGNQSVSMVSQSEAATIRAEIEKVPATCGDGSRFSGMAAFASDDVGYFYLIQLEPEHDSGRFKVGFTMDLDGRLQKHRCSAPFATYVRSWPCKRVWERAVIDCATKGCEQLHTEVFRAASLAEVTENADGFFSMMPTLTEDIDEDENDKESAPVDNDD